MTRSTFFKHFELLADQPDAVAKMRELVLELAVRGKLVSNGTQADKDGAWTKFCAEATAASSEISPAFDVPSHWHWARLEDVAAPCGQKKPDVRFTYVDVGAIDNERGLIKGDVEVVEPENAPSRARKLVAQNSVIYSTVRPYLKNIAIVDRKFSPVAIVSTAFAVLNPMDFLQSRYLYHWLRSRPFQSDVESKMKGVAYPAISDSELWQCLIPVPPPAEQRRIVAKVDELMALCDELEQRQQARQHASGLLQQSALHHLLAAREPQTFAAAWQRVRDHFHLLHDTPDAIPQLRQAILQLAVQGRLVPQNPKDEPAEKLLQGIAAKMQRDLTDWTESPHAPPCELPSSWLWARFDCVATIASNLVHPSKFPNLPHVAPDNIEKGTGRLLPYRTVKEDDVRSANHRFFPGQLVYSKIRPNLSKVVIVDFEGLCSADMYPLNCHINPDYLLRFILTQQFLSMAVRNDTRVAMPKINQEELNRVLVAVPPLAEQKRIVARVAELLRWCDTLEAQLHRTRTLGTHLLASTLHHLLAA